MATRKQHRRTTLLQVLALALAVVIVIVTVFLVQQWWNSRGTGDPESVRVTATVGDDTRELSPYALCEIGTDCAEREVESFPVAPDGEITIEVPKEISNNDWQLLRIYEDPAFNSQQFFGAHEADSITVKGSAEDAGEGEQAPRLVVIEITSVLLGPGSDGEETAYSATWSINTAPDVKIDSFGVTENNGANNSANDSHGPGESDAEAPDNK